jgi:restriction system protein
MRFSPVLHGRIGGMAYRKRSYRKGSDSSVGLLVGFICFVLLLLLQAGIVPNVSYLLPLVVLVGLLAISVAVSFLLWQRVKEKKRLRALELSDVDTMSGLDFERFVAEVLRSQGYQIRLTKVTGDYGGDIVARKDGVVSVVQVKRYKSVLGVEAIQQAVAAKGYYNASFAMVVTNTYFTAPSRQLAKVNGCGLVDRDRLASWIIAFQRGLSGNPESKA